MLTKITEILEGVKGGRIGIEEALNSLKFLPVSQELESQSEDVPFARIDLHRALRRGFPEVVFGLGKSVQQVVKICAALLSQGQDILVTKASPEMYEAVRGIDSRAVYHELARAITITLSQPPSSSTETVLIITAGTSDITVAEEAAVTASSMGSKVEKLYDVGVAGVHRLLTQKEKLTQAKVIIVVAGMEGALASVVGGLVDVPVIAVPTSVGYGASFNGLAALLAMLNSCAPGIVVVNIDNGFGAGYFASLIVISAAYR